MKTIMHFENLSLNTSFGMVFDTNGKNCSIVLILIYKQCFKFFKKIVSSLKKYENMIKEVLWLIAAGQATLKYNHLSE